MKNFSTLCLLSAIALLWPLNVRAQADPEAVKYLNEITTSFNELKGETWQYLKVVTRGKGAKKVENKRQKLLNEIREVKAVVKSKKPYRSDNALRGSVLQYLDLTHTVLSEDFGKILDMEEIAEQSYDLMEAYLLAKERANAKLDSASLLMQQAQEQFANQYQITLTSADEDKVTRKILRAGETLKYYNDIYLIFFKSYKQEAYVLDALQRNDVSALEQNANTLGLFATEGLVALKKVGNYQNDALLRLAAQQMLSFYKNESEKDFSAMVDFYIKKDNVDKVQKIIDAKSKKARTQQDVDQYNNAINEFNEAAQRFNQLNESAYQKRAKHLEHWNRQVADFFDKHAN